MVRILWIPSLWNIHYSVSVNLSRTNQTRFMLLGAMDTKLLEALYWKGVPVFDMGSHMSTIDVGWGSPTFHKMGREKVMLIDSVLPFGFELLMCDTDMVWLKVMLWHFLVLYVWQYVHVHFNFWHLIWCRWFDIFKSLNIFSNTICLIDTNYLLYVPLIKLSVDFALFCFFLPFPLLVSWYPLPNASPFLYSDMNTEEESFLY